MKFGQSCEIWPELWNMAEFVKCGWNCKIVLNLWNFFKIVKFGQNCEIWPKLWNLAVIVKFGRNFWSTPISLVWKGLNSSQFSFCEKSNFRDPCNSSWNEESNTWRRWSCGESSGQSWVPRETCLRPKIGGVQEFQAACCHSPKFCQGSLHLSWADEWCRS